MTVPASNAVVIFMVTSHVCRAITMPGCLLTTPRTARFVRKAVLSNQFSKRAEHFNWRDAGCGSVLYCSIAAPWRASRSKDNGPGDSISDEI